MANKMAKKNSRNIKLDKGCSVETALLVTEYHMR